jgi:hypothetical protein
VKRTAIPQIFVELIYTGPSATRFSERQWVWTVNTQPREDNWGLTWKKKWWLESRKPRLTVIGNSCGDHATTSTRKSRDYFADRGGPSVGIVPLLAKSHRVGFVCVYICRSATSIAFHVGPKTCQSCHNVLWVHSEGIVDLNRLQHSYLYQHITCCLSDV